MIVAPLIQRLIGGQEFRPICCCDCGATIPPCTFRTLPQICNCLDGSSIPYVRTIVRFPLYLAELVLGLREADVAHIFSAAFSSFLISTVPAFCVSRILGKKVLVNYRSGLAKKHLSASWIARRILQRADKVLVPSAYLVEVFREFHVMAQAIPNLVDLTLFSYRARDPLRPFLLCSRNLEPRYGIDLVLRAFSEVQKAFPEARLWVLGEGSQENAIRRLIAELNLTGVEMPGELHGKMSAGSMTKPIFLSTPLASITCRCRSWKRSRPASRW